MFKLLLILLFCMTVVLGELNFVKLTEDCVNDTFDDSVKSCLNSNNIEVYDLREGSSSFRCLTYNRDSIGDSHDTFDTFALKLTPPFVLHYTGAVVRSNNKHVIDFKVLSRYTARFAIFSNDSKFKINEVLVNERLVEKNWNCDGIHEISNLTCGKQAERSNDLTKFGLNSNPGDFPWAVAIFQNGAHQSHKYKCGGSIIATKHVITSVNCLLDEGRILLANEVTVHVARYSLESQSHFSRIYDISKVIPHQGFNFHLKDNIALLQTGSKMKFNDYVMPICLPSSQTVLKDALGKVVGFGKLSSDTESKSKFLAVAEYSVLDFSFCTSKDELLHNYKSTEHFCAENNSGNIRISDLGSGLYFNKTNTWFIGGIVSKSSSIPYESSFILFTHIQPYIPWIQSTLNTN